MLNFLFDYLLWWMKNVQKDPRCKRSNQYNLSGWFSFVYAYRIGVKNIVENIAFFNHIIVYLYYLSVMFKQMSLIPFLFSSSYFFLMKSWNLRWRPSGASSSDSSTIDDDTGIVVVRSLKNKVLFVLRIFKFRYFTLKSHVKRRVEKRFEIPPFVFKISVVAEWSCAPTIFIDCCFSVVLFSKNVAQYKRRLYNFAIWNVEKFHSCF